MPRCCGLRHAQCGCPASGPPPSHSCANPTSQLLRRCPSRIALVFDPLFSVSYCLCPPFSPLPVSHAATPSSSSSPWPSPVRNHTSSQTIQAMRRAFRSTRSYANHPLTSAVFSTRSSPIPMRISPVTHLTIPVARFTMSRLLLPPPLSPRLRGSSRADICR
jgi:hypothetical protein